MKKLKPLMAATLSSLLLLSACTGDPVNLGARSDQPVPKGDARVIQSSACGFQLMLFIPIGVNGRAEKAYNGLVAQADGGYITDVEVKEHWFYGFAGTGYCTDMTAKVIRPSAG